jgi:alpha-D-ribose 1-methylphosphonate 5-phosphate C-P lyase
MTATGTVNIRFFSQQLYATYATTSLSSTMCDASFDVPISRLIDKDIFLIPMPLGTDARLFRPVDSPSAVISTQENNGWQFIQIGVSGAPVGTIPINAYMYYHFEIIPGDGDATNAFAKAPPRNNPAVQNTNAGVLERVGNFIEGTVQSVDKVVKSKSMQYLLAGAAAYNGNPGPAAMLAIKDVN